MKKVFKASLVAASMAVAFSASAAQIISTPLKLSAEGIQAGVTDTTTYANFFFDVKVDQVHPSGTEVVLTFTDGVDLTGVSGAGCAPTTVTGQSECTDIRFSVGNGNFTFDNVAVDEDEGTITFNVQLGNAITAQSAFRIEVKGAEISDAVSVTYASNIGGTPIETVSKALTDTVAQFSYSVKTRLDQVIERPIARTQFTTPATNNDSTDNVDSLVLTVRNQDDLLLAATAGDLTLELGGNFKEGNGDAWVLGAIAGVVNGSENLLSFTVPAATAFTAAPAAQDHSVDFEKQEIADKLFATGFELTVKQAIAGIATPVTYATKADAGKWSVDAAVINVPYLPVGYSQFSGNVEVANLGTTDAEIIVEAVGKTGVKYGPVVLAKKAAKGAVTTVFESDLMGAFGLAKGDNEKLSVTFSIDADMGDVTLAPYYREGSARINVISDQYKADNIR